VDILDPCGADATATLPLDVTLSAGAFDRYDLAFYVSLNGNSARSGTSCYHDYLQPPLTTTPAYPEIHNGPWANLEPFDQNDSCGDVQANSDVTKTIRTPLLPIQVSCVEPDAALALACGASLLAPLAVRRRVTPDPRAA
jgi:hypothetical protein